MDDIKERIQRIGLGVKSALFTIVIHGTLLVILLVGQGFFPKESIKQGTTEPIQAQIISGDYIEQIKAVKLEQEKQKREQENKQLEDEKKRKQVAEKKRLVVEEKRKQVAEKKRLAAEKKKKQEAKKKRLAAEKKKKQEAKKKRLKAEKKKKQEAKKKRLAAEKKKKQEAEKKRLEYEERLKREQALKDKLVAEERKRQIAQTERDAREALKGFGKEINQAIRNNWYQPLNNATGLVATIEVKVSRNGEVLSVNVVKGSGDPFFDRSTVLAVWKASPLPFPLNPKYHKFINEFNIRFNPDKIQP